MTTHFILISALTPTSFHIVYFISNRQNLPIRARQVTLHEAVIEVREASIFFVDGLIRYFDVSGIGKVLRNVAKRMDRPTVSACVIWRAGRRDGIIAIQTGTALRYLWSSFVVRVTMLSK